MAEGAQGRRRPNARARAAQLRQQQQRRERRRRVLLVTGVAVAVVAVVVAMVLVYALRGSKKNSTSASVTPAPTSVVNALVGVPASVWQSVGQGSSRLPKPISGPSLTTGGKQRIIYIGAEYCPFCAAERWAVVNALARFGTWHNLGATSSSSIDVNPSTPTFTFRGASYESPYLVFEPVETQSNEFVNGNYKTIATPTPEQQQLEQQYGQDSQGHLNIPFVDFANKFVIVGATYDSAILSKKTLPEVVAQLTNPNGKAAQGILGSANALTATICETTGNKPSNVCSSPTIQGIQAKLAGQ